MAQIRVDQLTAKQQNISSEEAAALIMERRVLVNGVMVDKPGTSVDENAVITVKEKTKKYASRSGYKLEGALKQFGVDPTGKVVCDIGASNGGFTDCLLQHGAAHVFAVDVAYGILAWELRQSEKVTVMERTNARYLDAEKLGCTCDMVTGDVSFISLRKIFPSIDKILKEDGICVCLIKPQFEAPQKELGKNGTLKDRSILPGLFRDIFRVAEENHLYVQDLMVSPIHGQNGNIEFLAKWGRKPSMDEETLMRLTEEAASWDIAEE